MRTSAASLPRGLFFVFFGALACSRTSAPAPSAGTSAPASTSSAPAPAEEPSASATAAPEAPAPASAAASVEPSVSAPPAPPSPPAPAPSATASLVDAGASPWTTPEKCSVYETSPAYRSLSPEDRARSRLTCETKEEFRAFVVTRQACEAAADCTVLSGSCPFGCYVPVTKASASEVSAKLASLGERLDKAGHRCMYRCMAPPGAGCTAGRCVGVGK